MAIAILVIVLGLIVGVAIELALSKRRPPSRRAIDPSAVTPAPPQLPQPRFVEDGEGFRILGPVDYGDDETVEPEQEPDSDHHQQPENPN